MGETLKFTDLYKYLSKWLLKNQEVKGNRRTQNITEECNVHTYVYCILYSAILLYDFQTVSN